MHGAVSQSPRLGVTLSALMKREARSLKDDGGLQIKVLDKALNKN
jgi:hypothetical protein